MALQKYGYAVWSYQYRRLQNLAHNVLWDMLNVFVYLDILTVSSNEECFFSVTKELQGFHSVSVNFLGFELVERRSEWIKRYLQSLTPLH